MTRCGGGQVRQDQRAVEAERQRVDRHTAPGAVHDAAEVADRPVPAIERRRDGIEPAGRGGGVDGGDRGPGAVRVHDDGVEALLAGRVADGQHVGDLHGTHQLGFDARPDRPRWQGVELGGQRRDVPHHQRVGQCGPTAERGSDRGLCDPAGGQPHRPAGAAYGGLGDQVPGGQRADGGPGDPAPGQGRTVGVAVPAAP